MCLFTGEMTFGARVPCDKISVCVCVFTRKMKSGLLLLREMGDRLSEVDVSSELCEDGCRKV